VELASGGHSEVNIHHWPPTVRNNQNNTGNNQNNSGEQPEQQ